MEILERMREFMSYTFPQGDTEGAARAVEAKRRTAAIDVSRCLAWGGAGCQLCYLACHLRDKAIEMRDQKPVVAALFCDGCGMCVTACGTVNDLPAIRLEEEG